MRRRQVLAVAGSALAAGCLGDTSRDATSTTTSGPEECGMRHVLVVNGRSETVTATIVYVAASGEVSYVTTQTVDPNEGRYTLREDGPDFARVSVVEGRRGEPAVTVSCEVFPAEDPLRVYFHPAGGVEVRNARTTVA